MSHKTPNTKKITYFYECLGTLSCTFCAYILRRKGLFMTNFKNGVGQNIKLLRKIRGITQEDLSSIIGLHPRQLSKIETGDHFPSCRTLEKICIVLNIQPSQLFEFEFLTEENEGAMTGTDGATNFQVFKTKKDNVYQLFDNQESKAKTCTDESMANMAKALNKPLFVEYFDEKKSSKIVVFYPDGKEKVIKNSADVDAQRNLNYMVKEFKKIAKDNSASDFIKLSLEALKKDDALEKLSNLIEGMKLARGLSKDR